MTSKLRSLRTRWLSDCREIIEQPSVRNDVGLFSQNADSIFRCNMTLGMIEWRAGGDPSPFFNEAIDRIIRYRDDLMSRDMDHSKLPISTATILASLIDRQSEFSPDCELDLVGDCFLDCQLARRLQGKPFNRDVQPAFDRLGERKRQQLALRTYETYFELIDMDPASRDVRDAIAAAESNYSARRKDAFYAGGPDIEGGGDYNSLVVDYRLSAIMKCRGFQEASVHRWG